MANPKEPTRARQAKSEPPHSRVVFFKDDILFGPLVPDPISLQPVMHESGLYNAEQVEAALAISTTTLNQWVKDGLPVARRNSKRRHFVGRDIFTFMKANPNR